MVDIEDLKFSGENRVGSTPISPTILGIGVTVTRMTLTHLLEVRVLYPQPYTGCGVMVTRLLWEHE